MSNFKLNDEKFNEIFPLKSPRDGQREIIEQIIAAYESGKKYVILDAPCGIGKSVIGYAVAKYFNSAYILTSQKILQNQYYNDFKIPYVLGRNNYICLKNANFTCDLGACFRNPKKYCRDNNGNIKCPYIISRENCFLHNYSNLNYSYFLSLLSFTQNFKNRDLIICDEAHNCEGELIKIATIKLSNKILEFLGISLKIPDISDSDGNKCSWLITDFIEQLRSQYLYLESQIKKLNSMKVTREYKKIAKKFSTIEGLYTSTLLLKKQIENEERGSSSQQVVVSQDIEYIEYKPLFAKNIFKNSMDSTAKKFLFISDTILNPELFCKDLGIDYKKAEYIKCESKFSIENRLIHYTPIGSMSYKNKNITIPKLIKTIDKILKENKDVKGIIHTINYDVAEKIIEGLRFSDQSARLLMPRGIDKQRILDVFYSSNKPYILISPSLTEGIDLKDDLSRLCIVCKVPYASLADKWVKQRMNLDKTWYLTHACINLVQMTGRSVRSETDFAKTYILDKDFEILAENTQDIFPNWWKDSVTLS